MEQTSRLMTLASNVKLFNGIPMNLLGKMISFADKVEIMEGLTYFNEGDTGDSFYILIIGHVVVEQQKSGKWVQLAALHPGDSFGEMILVDDKVRSARVRATSDSTALYFPLQRLKSSPEILSSLYHNIAKILVKRLKNTNNVVMELHQKAREDARGGLPPPSPELVEAMKKSGDGDFVSYDKDEDAEQPVAAASAAAPAAAAAPARAAPQRPDDTPAHFIKKIKPMADIEFDMGSSIDPLTGLAAQADSGFDVEAGGEDGAAKAPSAGDSSVIIPELKLGTKKGIGPY